jgi:heme-degrading monooxygenase HmoA
MMYAMTVRKLKPGTFEQFREAFMQPFATDDLPPGLQRFSMVRGTGDPDEVICFGLFDGGPEDLRANADSDVYERQQAAIAPFVESVGADGFFDIVEDRTP